jgi:Mor family transcriptional regulator
MAKKSETLTEIREHFIAALVEELGKPIAEANSIAHCVVGVIREKWGGCESLYIPKSDTLDNRDWQMWEMFNGSNYDEVGKAFDLTGRQVRNRIRIIRPIAQARDQKGLFDSFLKPT